MLYRILRILIRYETAGSAAQTVMDEAVLPLEFELHASVALVCFFAQHARGARDAGGRVEF